MKWNDKFDALFARCTADYKAGKFDYEKDYSSEDLEFLASIGYKKREFFDFIEDFVDEGVPSQGTALLVAAVRRDYFIVVQGKEGGGGVVCADDLPGFKEEMDGIAYLPRILKKAGAKLRGELDPDLMFGCGGDRKFLARNGGIHPADFLRRVWAADGDDEQVVSWVKSFT